MKIGSPFLIWFHVENSGVDCDKRVNVSNMEGGGLEDVQNRETRREERTEDEHEDKDEQPIGRCQRLQIVGRNWWKTSGTSKRTSLFKDWESAMTCREKYS